MTEVAKPGALARALADFRTTHVVDVGPRGCVATLSAFGPIADAAWQDLGGINESVRRALERGQDYEPVSSFQVSYSTGAGLYVAARHWIGEDHGVKDLITWSTGPKISFRVHSGAGPGLVDNPHWNHIKNIDPRLRGEHGYELRASGWYYPEHHFDVVAPSTMLDSELRRQIQLSAQAFLGASQENGIAEMDINVATFVVAVMTFFAAVVGVYLAFMQIVRQDRDREERLDELERQQIIEHHRIHDRAVNAYQITGWEAMPPEWIVEWRQQHPRRKRSLLDRIRRR